MRQVQVIETVVLGVQMSGVEVDTELAHLQLDHADDLQEEKSTYNTPSVSYQRTSTKKSAVSGTSRNLNNQ